AEEVTCTYSNRNQQRNKDLYYDYEAHDEHLQSLPRFIDDGEESDSSANKDQCEIVTDIEDSENSLVNLNKYLNMDSTDDDEASTDEEREQTVLEKSIGEDEFQQDDDSDDPVLSNLISSTTTPITSVSSAVQLQKPLAKATGNQGSTKRKRKQWSIKEKLSALNSFEKKILVINSLLLINMVAPGINRHNGLKGKMNLKHCPSSSMNKGKIQILAEYLLSILKKKQTFIDAKAVATTGTTTTATIRREKVTFRQLERQGKLLSCGIKTSLSKNQKVSLSDAYSLINNFYDYIRRASRWAPSRGPMGASLPRDVCNLDESPLSLFGDQSRLSINDVNTSNDIEGCISNKRFATVILTIFGSDNTRAGPVLIFKGKGQASSIEKMQYANGVKVYFTPKAVNNRITMDKDMEYWMSEVNDKNPKLFISDSSNAHIDHQSIRLLRKKQIFVAVIPKGCTMYIQALDVYVFSIFKTINMIAQKSDDSNYLQKTNEQRNVPNTNNQTSYLTLEIQSPALTSVPNMMIIAPNTLTTTNERTIITCSSNFIGFNDNTLTKDDSVMNNDSAIERSTNDSLNHRHRIIQEETGADYFTSMPKRRKLYRNAMSQQQQYQLDDLLDLVNDEMNRTNNNNPIFPL
ncbi:unnamed protein product, partial [Rotaria socialis]